MNIFLLRIAHNESTVVVGVRKKTLVHIQNVNNKKKAIETKNKRKKNLAVNKLLNKEHKTLTKTGERKIPNNKQNQMNEWQNQQQNKTPKTTTTTRTSRRMNS